MRTPRPSGKAVLVAGALALTLVVGATSGAIAGKLITSADIQDGTIKSRDIRDNAVKNKDIARGAVNWQKSLSEPTRRRIAALAGVPGPQGEVGPAGPQGEVGPQGPRGNDGVSIQGPPGSTFVAAEHFGSVVPEDIEPYDDSLVPLPGTQADTITLSDPGVYLVNARVIGLGSEALVLFQDIGSTVVPDDPDDADELELFQEFVTAMQNACVLGTSLNCQSTFPVFVSDTPVTLGAWAGSICGCLYSPLVTMTIFKLAGSGSIPDLPAPVFTRRAATKLVQKYERYVS